MKIVNGVNFSAEIGLRIREVRTKKLCMNQADFAKAIGAIQQNYISRYETGTQFPNFWVLIRIAQIGNVSLDWLITGERHVKLYKQSAA